jgi:hypothetical protein
MYGIFNDSNNKTWVKREGKDSNGYFSKEYKQMAKSHMEKKLNIADY